jgi:iron(III) transport system ATP-binding protein
MNGLQVSDLHKSFATNPVLTGLDLEVPAGSLTAILGSSGSGKTTLLRLLAGFETPDRGTVTIGARVVDTDGIHVHPEQRRIGYVPQEGGLFPHLTVQANVAFGLTRAQRRQGASDLLEMVGLSGLERRYPHQLSGGQQQRVALARALAIKPEIVLLDEPFASLDATLRTSVREEVHTLLGTQGTTTVLVTHDQEEALSLADSVAVLRDGVIVQQGTPSELYNTPVDSLLASFLGVANLLEARFDGETAHTPLGQLQLTADRDRPPGRKHGVVIVRPEQLRVSSGGDDEPGMPGTIEQCRYYGHDALLYIRPLEPPQATALVARVRGEQALAPGTAVRVLARGKVSTVE